LSFLLCAALRLLLAQSHTDVCSFLRSGARLAQYKKSGVKPWPLFACAKCWLGFSPAFFDFLLEKNNQCGYLKVLASF